MKFNDEAKLNFAMEHVLHLEDLYDDDWNSDISIHISNLKYELQKEQIRLNMKRKDAKIVSGNTRI
tara:strand:- start:905 stop:1102 length:198 start_codon:yes stop_codon:yes gene_type:complete